jgi:hypothetical protein
VEIQLARESFTCSGGHPFWVCGESWVKARELAPGKLLHRVTGSTAIVSVEPAPAEPVYNLIVADSHTYFVGKAKILSHDITIRRPTDAIVPGLAKR